MFPSLATMEARLTSFQCCSLKMFPNNKVSLLLCACVTLSETMFPHLATGAAKHFVFFPLISVQRFRFLV